MIMKLEFVKYIPRHLDEEALYFSLEFNTVNHLCACGCGLEVVTPLSPKGWRVTYNGETISLYPSIGNWQFPCKSHYWIIENEVVWADDWSTAEESDEAGNKPGNQKDLDEETPNSFYSWFKRILE
jgi:hypothetical protein